MRATSWTLPRSLYRANIGERKLIVSMVRRCCGFCWPSREESRAFARWYEPEDEDRRRIGRERKALMVERVAHVNRIKGLPFSQGIAGYEPLRKDRRQRLDQLQTGDGRALPQCMRTQICRELDRLELVIEQLKAVEDERDAFIAVESADKTKPSPVTMLLEIKGLGAEFVNILWAEGLFRHFDNRRQVAAYAGLVPTPWQSGSIKREQGVSKAGNSRLRTTLIQMSWLWLRNQPASTLANGSRHVSNAMADA